MQFLECFINAIFHIPRHPGEEEIVYSPQISQIFPQLYIQPKFKLIEEIVKNDPNLLERNFLKYAKKDSLFRSNKRHKIAFYQGKGSLTRSYSKNLKLIIKEADITLITRDYPSSKSALYSLIGTLDGLISLDPLSSLNYESTLLVLLFMFTLHGMIHLRSIPCIFGRYSF